MSFSKFASFVSKVTIEVMRNFFECLPRIVTLQNYVVNHECFSLFMLSSFYKARANTLPRVAKQWKLSVRQLYLLRQKWQILKMTLPQKKRPTGHRIQTPSSKLMILVSSCWEKNDIRNNGHSLFILSLVFFEIIECKCCFLSGPPCTCIPGPLITYRYSRLMS